MDKYILNEHGEAVMELDPIKWGRWFGEGDNHRVLETTIHAPDGDIWVSTIFLGLDHKRPGDPWPILWKTMAFRQPGLVEIDSERYPLLRGKTLAVEGHWRMVHKLMAEVLTDPEELLG